MGWWEVFVKKRNPQLAVESRLLPSDDSPENTSTGDFLILCVAPLDAWGRMIT